MQTRRFWRFIAAAGITLILYTLLLLSGGVNPIAEIPEGAREDELERAYERGSQWLDDRERRFARKIDQVKNWLEGGATSAALSDQLIGMAFRTIGVFKNGEPEVWTRFIPQLHEGNESMRFLEENGQVLAYFKHTIASADSGTVYSIVGLTVISGPSILGEAKALPSLEAEFKRSGIPVRIEASRISEAGSLKDLLAFDRQLWTESNGLRWHRIRIVLFLFWALSFIISCALFWKQFSNGIRVTVPLTGIVMLLVWLFVGRGFEAIVYLTGLPEFLLPLFKYAAVNAGAISALILIIWYLAGKKRLFGVIWYPRTIAFSMGYGLLSAAVWLNFPSWISYPLNADAIRPFDVGLVTNGPTFVYFAVTGLTFIVVSVFFVVLGRFLFGSEHDQITWVTPLMNAGFALGLGVWLAQVKAPLQIWPLLLFTGIFILLQRLGYYWYKHRNTVLLLSRPRLFIVCSIVTVMWCYGFIYTGFNSQTIKNASRAADKIMIEDKAVAEHLARVLPRFVLRTFPFSILYEPSDELKKAVKEVERPEWSAFEISLYRVENGVPGVEIFSTVRFRQPPRLMHLVQESLPEIQDGITLKTVRLDGIEPVTIGFTPAPGRTNSGVVAVIRPRYALADGAFDLVFEKDVFPAFPSFSVALYQQDQLLHRFFHGVAKPEFVADPVLTASGQGSSFIPEFAKDGFRSVVFPYRNGEAILLAFPDLGLSDHAFAAVRFFLVVIITLLAIYTILLVVFQKVPDFLATRQRLQLRILDSYILSSLMFLVLLIIVTHVAVQRRASAEFRRNFEQKLEEYRQELSRTPYLEWLDKAYNGDYLLFEGPFLLTSSRMQLTQNGLLPETLPYSIMARMSEEMQPRFIRSFTLAGVPIQAGILRLNAGDKQKDPFYIVIPAYEDTYSQAEYLFKTTGFLIIIYTALFGFFIAGAAFISRHLSRPLADLSSGLRRVATGEFSTTVPVTTQDEIGDLANAYNLMIYKLQDLQRELAEAERQAALSEMARQVAHEIKNPLTPMKLSIQFLQRQIMQRDKPLEELQEAVNRICQTVVEQIDSLNAIASDFSRFAKPVNGIFMKTDINRVATDIIDLYRHDRRITIIPDLNETPLYVHAVGDELKRVFINLVKNSDEAMPEGGVLIIRTYAFKDLVYAEVVDNGVGIPVEMQGRIFTPNFSTKTSGTGLGLAICKKIVEAHKGEIGFASVPGTGTTFTLIFPAWKETDGMRAALPEGAV